MTAPADDHSTPPGQHPRVWVRVGIALGWLMLAYFVGRTTWLHRVIADVRAFQIAYAVGFIGFLILALAAYRGRAGELGSWRWWILGCIALRLIPTGVEPSDDAYRYVWEGRVQHAGFNPYCVPPDDPKLAHLRDDDWRHINHPDYTAIYPPLAQIQFLLTTCVSTSIYAIKFVHVLWDALIVIVLGRILRREELRPHLAIMYGLCPLTLTAIALEGHLDSLMLLPLALMVLAHRSGKPLLAGAMLGLAISAKLVALLMGPWLVWRHPRAAVICVGVVILTYVPYLGAGPDLFGSLHRWPQETEFFSLLGAIGVTRFETAWPKVWTGLGLMAIIGWLCLRSKKPDHVGQDTFTALLLASPIVHPWYLTWPLLFAPLRQRWCWVLMGAAMVCYYQAGIVQVRTGAWAMPLWVPKVVWGVWLATAAGEMVWWQGRKARARLHVRRWPTNPPASTDVDTDAID